MPTSPQPSTSFEYIEAALGEVTFQLPKWGSPLIDEYVDALTASVADTTAHKLCGTIELQEQYAHIERVHALADTHAEDLLTRKEYSDAYRTIFMNIYHALTKETLPLDDVRDLKHAVTGETVHVHMSAARYFARRGLLDTFAEHMDRAIEEGLFQGDGETFINLLRNANEPLTAKIYQAVDVTGRCLAHSRLITLAFDGSRDEITVHSQVAANGTTCLTFWPEDDPRVSEPLVAFIDAMHETVGRLQATDKKPGSWRRILDQAARLDKLLAQVAVGFLAYPLPSQKNPRAPSFAAAMAEEARQNATLRGLVKEADHYRAT